MPLTCTLLVGQLGKKQELCVHAQPSVARAERGAARERELERREAVCRRGGEGEEEEEEEPERAGEERRQTEEERHPV